MRLLSILKRNSGQRGYRPKQAQKFSQERRKTAHKARKVTEEVYEKIKILILQELSPQQAVSYMEKHERTSLHHETIYQLVYADKRSGDLYPHLRIISKPYRKRYGSSERRGRIKNRESVDERPDVVERRNHIGDWEEIRLLARDVRLRY